MEKRNLLKEELKRHMQLLEYTFYMPETDDDEFDIPEDLILGTETLYEQDPPGEEEDPFATPEAEEGGDAPAEFGAEEVETVDPEEPAAPSDLLDVDPFATDEEGLEVEDEFATEEGGDETVEVDVTDIVDKAEETRNDIAGLTAKMEELLGNFNSLSDQVTGMDQVIDKIEGLEKEIEIRNPTPVERLEMRSLDSFPYSVKLTDYWADKEGYDNGEEEKDYTITQKDVDDYSKTDVEKSFDYDTNDEDY